MMKQPEKSALELLAAHARTWTVEDWPAVLQEIRGIMAALPRPFSVESDVSRVLDCIVVDIETRWGLLPVAEEEQAPVSAQEPPSN